MASGAGGSGSGGFIVGITNPVGTGTGINFIGEHMYGMSGVGSAGSGGDFVGFDFTSPSNSYIKAKMFTSYDAEDLASGNQFGYSVSLNDQLVFFTRREAHAADQVNQPLPSEVRFIIPPDTRTIVTGFNNGSGVDMAFILEGRVY
jgi:hypothetical protein